jgi:hypothetical protein
MLEYMVTVELTHKIRELRKWARFGAPRKVSMRWTAHHVEVSLLLLKIKTTAESGDLRIR